MTFEIMKSSPEAAKVKPKPVKGVEDRKTAAKYPFEELEVNQSFTIELDKEGKWKNLRTRVYQRNARPHSSKEFAFIRHNKMEPPLCEVARIA